MEDYLKDCRRSYDFSTFEAAADRKLADGTQRRLARDDSTISCSSIMSSISNCSVSSEEVTEFLEEFRMAYVSSYGADSETLTKGQLAEMFEAMDQDLMITDEMLHDLFDEIDVQRHGAIGVMEFMAQVNHRIQGRFCREVIKHGFNAIASGRPGFIRREDVKAAFWNIGRQISDEMVTRLCKDARLELTEDWVSFADFEKLTSIPLKWNECA
jgi:Ca2+-binding EF-hand superfamily protein